MAFERKLDRTRKNFPPVDFPGEAGSLSDLQIGDMQPPHFPMVSRAPLVGRYRLLCFDFCITGCFYYSGRGWDHKVAARAHLEDWGRLYPYRRDALARVYESNC